MKKLSIELISMILAIILLAASSLAIIIPTAIRAGSSGNSSSDGTEIAPEEIPSEEENSDEDFEEDSDNPPGGESDDTEDSPEEDTPVIEPIQNATYARAKVNGLNLRSGPGSGYAYLGYINAGDMVVLLAKEGDWYRTQYKNKTAYISASSAYTEPFEIELSGNAVIEKVIEEGLQLLGYPYVYGAIRYHDGAGRRLSNFDPTKYDCSSLMQYIFYHGANVNLNMTTRTQVKQGTYVPKSDLKRGDLMFFTNSSRYNNTGIERIGHVALYLGENYILHTASDYAVIEEISTQRWKYYIETRRLV